MENRINITKSSVDSLPIPTQEQVGKAGYLRYWDTKLAGFYMKVSAPTRKSPEGRKAYVIRYENQHGQERHKVLGLHGPLNPDQARAKALGEFAKVANGKDPVEDGRSGGEECTTMAELFDAYLAEQIAKKGEQTIDAATRALAIMRALIGKRSPREIKTAHIVIARDKIEGKGNQNKCVDYVRSAWNWGAKRGRVPEDKRNPAKGIEANVSRSMKKSLTPDQYRRLGEAVREMLMGAKHDHSRALAILFCAYTGCRPVESLRIRPGMIDWDRRVISLNDHKTMEKTGEPKEFLITDQIEWILERAEALRKIRGDHGYIFPRRGAKEKNFFNRCWAALQKRAGLEGVVQYNLRSGFVNVATHGTSLTDSETADLTQHADVKVLRTHYKKFDSPKTRANATKVGEFMADQMGFNNVVPLTSTAE